MIELANKKYGLDQPLLVQFKNYVLNYLRGDLGVSLKMQEGTEVSKIIFGQGKFELSLKLGLLGLALAVLIGIPLGCIAAYKRGSWLDGFLRVVTTIGVAIPTFVLATLMLVFFAVQLGWLPVKSNTLPDFKSYIMPVISLSSYYTCYVAKLTRTSMLDAINQDYIRTARAKGVKTSKLVLKHALRNSLIPVITYLGPVTAGIITGSFVVESTFQIPGLGRYFVQSVLNRDYTVIMATTVILSALVIIMNLVVDLVYRLVDPRITLTTKGD
jgi:oligopeptide transport system permease protein